MARDAFLTFSDQQALSGAGSANSTNVYDAAAAKKLFGGTAHGKVAIEVTAAGGTSPTFEAKVVAADDAALTSNVVTLVDTGTSAASPTTPALYELAVSNQAASKRYYGVIYTLGGTSPTATVNAQFVDAAENNQVV